MTVNTVIGYRHEAVEGQFVYSSGDNQVTGTFGRRPVCFHYANETRALLQGVPLELYEVVCEKVMVIMAQRGSVDEVRVGSFEEHTVSRRAASREAQGRTVRRLDLSEVPPEPQVPLRPRNRGKENKAPVFHTHPDLELAEEGVGSNHHRRQVLVI